jgi:biotin synthase
MNDHNWLIHLTDSIKNGGVCDKTNADKILQLEKEAFHLLLYAATELRYYFKKNYVKTCSIVNAKSGRCSEDCSFCAQSAFHKTDINTYQLMQPDIILAAAASEENYSRRFGIVTAGKGLGFDDIQSIKETFNGFAGKVLKQTPCASFGILSEEQFDELKDAGLERYHHNLEVCRNYYSKICTTHSYDDRIETIKRAKKVGLELCIGGIFGLGESINDRIDLMCEIKECEPDSVPLNFLVPIKGTPLEDTDLISLWEATKIVALSRFIMPEKDIILGAGRLEIFKDAQHLAFLAGANGMIIGNLLTVKGRSVEEDIKVITDLGLEISA